MMLRAFSVYDSKSEVYMIPFFLQTTAAGLRMFGDAVNDPASAFAKHPGDYTLFEIGLFDDNKGSMIPIDTHVNHGSAITFKKNTLSVSQGAQT